MPAENSVQLCLLKSTEMYWFWNYWKCDFILGLRDLFLFSAPKPLLLLSLWLCFFSLGMTLELILVGRSTHIIFHRRKTHSTCFNEIHIQRNHAQFQSCIELSDRSSPDYVHLSACYVNDSPEFFRRQLSSFRMHI